MTTDQLTGSAVDVIAKTIALELTRKVLTREDAAQRLSMSLTTFERKVQPHLRLVAPDGGRPLVPVAELDRWITERQALGGAA